MAGSDLAPESSSDRRRRRVALIVGLLLVLIVFGLLVWATTQHAQPA